VTSRRPIPGPDGTVHTRVDMLSTADAVALLARIVGPRKVAAELLPRLGPEITPSAAAKAADWPKPPCGGSTRGTGGRATALQPGPRNYAYYGLVNLLYL